MQQDQMIRLVYFYQKKKKEKTKSLRLDQELNLNLDEAEKKTAETQEILDRNARGFSWNNENFHLKRNT